MKTQVLELRRYQFRFGPGEARHGEYVKSALLPALNRAGITPVGVFSVSLGQDSPATYMLLPHPSAESAVTLGSRLVQDAEYKAAAASFRSLPPSDPPYLRRSSVLLTTFESVPRVEVPNPKTPTRNFELRTYASHNEGAGLKKIEMFEKGGELQIFRKVGLNPVFFGRTVIGPNMPNLMYMVSFADAAARDKAWAAFRDDPDWVKLRSTPGYANADIMTNITVELLRPTDYSQI